MQDDTGNAQLPWKLLGVHSARLEMAGRSLPVEESLDLNCAWYADFSSFALIVGGLPSC